MFIAKIKMIMNILAGIVSRALIEQAGWSSPEMALNQTISWENKHVTIVGVFDFVEFNSGVTSQTPVILGLSYSSQGRWTIATKLSDGCTVRYFSKGTTLV